MTIQEELKRLYDFHKILRPADVVEFAKNPETALHKSFDWDDSSAASKYRLEQARALIRVNVRVLSNNTEPVRAFVSLKSDRYDKDYRGGYRTIEDVLSDDEMHAELLQQAKAEADAYRERYRALKELEPVFNAMEQVFQEQPAAAV